jgi:hypothetical protein
MNEVKPRIKINEGRWYCIVTAHGDLKGLVGQAQNVTITGFGHCHFDLYPVLNPPQDLKFRVRDTDVMPVVTEPDRLSLPTLQRNAAILKKNNGGRL